MLIWSRFWPLVGILFSALVFRSGTAVTTFALPWLITSLTSSSFWTSVAVSSCLLMSVVGLLTGGALIDRLGPVSTIRITGLCGSVAIALVPLLHEYDLLVPLILVPLVAVTTLFDSAVSSAQDNRIPEIAGFARVSLRRVIATKSVIGYAASMGAPLIAAAVAHELGVVLTLWHSSICLLLGCGLSSLAIARCIASTPPSIRSENFSIVATLVRIWRDVCLRSSIIVTAGAIAIIGAASAVVVPGLLRMRAGDVQEYGGFIAAISGGSMLGSVIYGLVGDRLEARVINAGGFALISLSMALLGFLASSPALVVAGIFLGMAVSPMAAAMSMFLYQRIDVELRGRSFGIVSAMITCVTPLAMVLIGYGVDAFGPRAILHALALAAALILVAQLLFRLDSNKSCNAAK